MKNLATINPRNISETEVREYSIRQAARAIVFDNDKNVALLHVSRDGYYKIPGGGIDKGEDRIDALKRECKEEIGCDIEVIGEVGSTTEYWKEDKEKQTSYCYIAKLIGERGAPNYTESESIRGFAPVWLPYQEALKSVEESTPTDYEGDYIVPRDLTFLKEAGDLLN